MNRKWIPLDSSVRRCLTLTCFTTLVVMSVAQTVKIPSGLPNQSWRRLSRESHQAGKPFGGSGSNQVVPESVSAIFLRNSDQARIDVSIELFKSMAEMNKELLDEDVTQSRLTQVKTMRRTSIKPVTRSLIGRHIGDRFWGPTDTSQLGKDFCELRVTNGLCLIRAGFYKLGKDSKGFVVRGKVTLADYKLLENYVLEVIRAN